MQGADYEFLETVSICKGDSFNESNNLTHAEAYQRALQIYKLQQEKNMEIITGKIKKALHNLATQRFPQLKPTLKTCDAILIAEYGKRKELGDER